MAIGFAVGVVMNMVQVATSLQDSAFSTFPRLGAFLVGFSVLMPWMINHWISVYTLWRLRRKSRGMGTRRVGAAIQLDIGTLFAFLLVLARVVRGTFIYRPADAPARASKSATRKSRAWCSPSA